MATCAQCEEREEDLLRKDKRIKEMQLSITRLRDVLEQSNAAMLKIEKEADERAKIIAELEDEKGRMIEVKQARKLAYKALQKGRALQLLGNVSKHTTLHLYFKRLAWERLILASYGPEGVKRMKRRMEGLGPPVATDAQLMHLRKEQIFLINENQKLMEKVSGLQKQLRGKATRGAEEADDFVEMDEAQFEKAIATWKFVLQARQRTLLQGAFARYRNERYMRGVASAMGREPNGATKVPMGPLAEEVTPPSAPFGSQLAMRPFYYDFLPSVKWRQPANRFVPVSLEPPTNHGGAPPPPPKPSQPSVVMGMPPNGGAPTVGMSAQMPFTRVPGAGLHGSAGPSRRQPAWGPMDYSEEPLGGGGESPLRTAMRESQGRVEAALEGDGDIEGGPLGGIRGKRLEGEGGRGGGANSWQ
eukprot:Cvel_16427.t1-p1 / transcript=Cvel_16427.t1 / gene=Cvel_16427 / organism=Chromera_velia_CCMP2878 / gene_product=hypothetical protein / transcript_product=hypothetical protein / location=Cvel_scaffold1266:1-2801(-) / protein_length=415 / sequence_SO=supercontig / SO=protein_coding / is_pseudo=false